MKQTALFAFLWITALAAGPSCTATVDPDPSTAAEVGSVELALRSPLGDRTFELRNATFSVTGTADVQLSSSDSPESPVIERELPVGTYTATLEPDWELVELIDGDPVSIEAVLTSENPVEFSISAGVRTGLTFRFAIDEGEVTIATGSVALDVHVAYAQVGDIVITEMMPNPAELADSSGEWIELHNVSNASISLQGCTVERDSTSFTIGAALVLEPGEFATIASSAAPGFEPSYVHGSLGLPNSGSYLISLHCDGAVLDAVPVDSSTWPAGAGVAASLSLDHSTALDNDEVQHWCAATGEYNSDLGSPGAANPRCER